MAVKSITTASAASSEFCTSDNSSKNRSYRLSGEIDMIPYENLPDLPGDLYEPLSIVKDSR